MKYLLIILIILLSNSCFGTDIVSQESLLTDKQSDEVYEKVKDKIIKVVKPAKDDYVDSKNRGTVYFNPEKGNVFGGKEKLKVRNYSFHKVVIPDGTTIEEVNFSQDKPHTNAIQGKDLIFIKCNLKNVEIDSTWKIIDCLTIHAQTRKETKDNKEYEVYEVEKDGIFIEVNREEIIDPSNIIKSE